MHLRSRKPLQDTLAATRLALPVAECGWQLAGNAEQHLRCARPARVLYEPQWLENTLRFASHAASRSPS
jgi:error-prone DNA polymerase